MRKREDIQKEYIHMRKGFMMLQPERAKLLNPRLQLEVLLDIRDLLIEKK